MTPERLWKVLDGIQTQIRAYDSKAQIVIAIDGIIAGFLGANVAKLADVTAASSWGASVLLTFAAAITSAALIASLTYAGFTIQPRLKLNQPRSLTFFLHIANQFGSDYAAARSALTDQSEPEHSEDLANQILANSIVCRKKSQRFNWALLWMAVAVVSWVLTLGCQFGAQRSVDRKQPTCPVAPQEIYIDRSVRSSKPAK